MESKRDKAVKGIRNIAKTDMDFHSRIVGRYRLSKSHVSAPYMVFFKPDARNIYTSIAISVFLRLIGYQRLRLMLSGVIKDSKSINQDIRTITSNKNTFLYTAEGVEKIAFSLYSQQKPSRPTVRSFKERVVTSEKSMMLFNPKKSTLYKETQFNNTVFQTNRLNSYYSNLFSQHILINMLGHIFNNQNIVQTGASKVYLPEIILSPRFYSSFASKLFKKVHTEKNNYSLAYLEKDEHSMAVTHSFPKSFSTFHSHENVLNRVILNNKHSLTEPSAYQLTMQQPSHLQHSLHHKSSGSLYFANQNRIEREISGIKEIIKSATAKIEENKISEEQIHHYINNRLKEIVNINRISEQVYYDIERRIRFERERRGL